MKKENNHFGAKILIISSVFLLFGFFVGLVVMNSAITGHPIFNTSWTIPSKTVVIDDGPLINNTNQTNLTITNVTKDTTLEELCSQIISKEDLDKYLEICETSFGKSSLFPDDVSYQDCLAKKINSKTVYMTLGWFYLNQVKKSLSRYECCILWGTKTCCAPQ